MVLFEILTGKTPYAGYTPIQIVRALDSGKRPELPKDCHPQLCELISLCWHQNYNIRPEFSVIIETLNSME